MRSVDALETLELLGSSHWGLVTTAQARAAGLSNVQLARLADQGTLSRVRHGVYALPSAGAGPLQDLQAAWLAASRTQDAGTSANGVVVSGASAAVVHDLGDLVPAHHEFSSTERRQSAQPDVRFHRASLGSDDVTVVGGLPVTTVERTVADLTARALDSDHLATVLADAVTHSRSNPKALASALERNAHRYYADSGAALVAELAPSTASYWTAVATALTDELTVHVSDELRKNLVTLLSSTGNSLAREHAFAELARTAYAHAA